mmetsp:Transcript_65766/g.106622  ORF Transcript_65766/g.106622 Transcript_65766/m.106622 type:complete len:95 (+) Transcript_65766:218-502(+)
MRHVITMQHKEARKAPPGYRTKNYHCLTMQRDSEVPMHPAVPCLPLFYEFVAVCCSVWQYVAACCNGLQRVRVCCIVQTHLVVPLPGSPLPGSL